MAEWLRHVVATHSTSVRIRFVLLMKMIGKLGWRGQCSCCNDKADMKAAEKHAWQREAEEEMELDDE